MIKKIYTIIAVLIVGFAAHAQVNVSLKLDEIRADSWAEFNNPTINSIQVTQLTYTVYNKNGKAASPENKVVPGGEMCNPWPSAPSTRTEWHQVPSGFYQRNFTINEFQSSDNYAIIKISTKGYHKRSFNSFCECNETRIWDRNINCFWFLGRERCLGGFVGLADKFCDQNYTVQIRIDSNSTPYIINNTGQLTSPNGRYGANFQYSFTPPLSKQPDIVAIPVISPGLPAPGDGTIKQNTVCSGETFSLLSKGGFNGVVSYKWLINGTLHATIPVTPGTRTSTGTIGYSYSF